MRYILSTVFALSNQATTSSGSVVYVSLTLAAAAFTVALVSLYLGNLKRADIQLLWLKDRPFSIFNQKHRDEGPPEFCELRVPIAIINSGARPGVIVGLDVYRTQDPFFAIHGCSPDPNFRDGALGALAVLGGESQVIVVQVTVAFPEEAVTAWRDGVFRSFDILVTYRYLRGRRVRPTLTRSVEVRVPLEAVVWKS